MLFQVLEMDEIISGGKGRRPRASREAFGRAEIPQGWSRPRRCGYNHLIHAVGKPAGGQLVQVLAAPRQEDKAFDLEGLVVYAGAAL